MAIQKQTTEYRDPWDLSQPGVKETLRAFERELNAYEGPWKIEQWLLDHGHIIRDDYFRVLEVTLPDGRVVRKPEYSAIKNWDQCIPKYLALRKLQQQTAWAKAHEEVPPPIEEQQIWS